jgi:chromosome segregation ATPase
MKTRFLLSSAAVLAFTASAFAAGESHTARQPGGLRAVTMDATATAEIRNLIGEVRTSLEARDVQMQAAIKKAEDDIAKFGAVSAEVKAELVKQVEASAQVQGRLQSIEQALAALKTEPNKAQSARPSARPCLTTRSSRRGSARAAARRAARSASM